MVFNYMQYLLIMLFVKVTAAIRHMSSIIAAGLCTLLSPPLDVRVEVEVCEEDDEGYGVADESVVHPLGEVTVDV